MHPGPLARKGMITEETGAKRYTKPREGSPDKLLAAIGAARGGVCELRLVAMPVTSNSLLQALIHISLRTDTGNTNVAREPMMHADQQTLDS